MVREIKTLREAIRTYRNVKKAELDTGNLFYQGKVSEQYWVDTVYRVLCFPSMDVNWKEISMSKELEKEF
ncbi:hypothetical protein [Citrobacter meridianamericanus]|uniref:hypothetical protein n=1 Tax=Citrobacter meridianamericanus TaxID=2894201 RepID=UPI00351D7789